ncbi:hypothetical protein NDU88_007076 [Pleurodeles waltl]|uniref:Uncharacterized protein n=1 Tax=Pleurodeles waltl TaxID=8319 RepID=A0AAV7UMU9_PLEWA|nr:hypothetical protein NDU88_007076 [Pleurodeles waltl]
MRFLIMAELYGILRGELGPVAREMVAPGPETEEVDVYPHSDPLEEQSCTQDTLEVCQLTPVPWTKVPLAMKND